jgi:hypothetical protein
VNGYFIFWRNNILKSIFIEERNLDSMWFALLSEVYKHGRKNHIDTGSFAGADRLEFDYVAGTIKYPTDRPLSPIMPEGVPPVTTDEEIEKYFVNYLMDGTLDGNNHYKYATWIVGGEYKLPKSDLILSRGIKSDGSISKMEWKGNNIIANVPNKENWLIKQYKEKY